LRVAVISIASLFLVLVLVACNGDREGNAAVTNEHAAAKIAEAAFLKATNHEITDYSIRAREHTAQQWRFQIEGRGRFERPGYHWSVSVDRVSGNTAVLVGQ